MAPQKISSNRINPEMLPKNPGEILTQKQFENIVKSGNFQIFDLKGLNQARLDIFNAAKGENAERRRKILKKANSDFSTLIRKAVELNGPKGKRVIDIYLRPIKKAEPGDPMGSFKQKDSMEHNEDDNKGLSPEEKELLSFVAQVLGEKITPDEAEGANDSADEETKQLLSSLESKGYIQLDENGGVSGITDEGKKLIGGSDNEGGEDNQDNQGDEGQDNQDKDVGSKEGEDAGDKGDKGIGPIDKETDEEDTQGNENTEDNQGGDEGDQGDQGDQEGEDNQGDQDNGEGQEDQQGDQQGDEQENGNQPDEGKLVNHAKQSSSQDLKAFVADENNDPKLKQIAQNELDAREKGDSTEPNQQQGQEQQGDETDQQGEDQNGEQVDEQDRKELMVWIDKYFDEHDIEDFRKYITELISQSPKELKVLKEHYRNDYSQKNSGNQLSEIDDNEFGDWMKEYLAHQPYPHLKDYAIRLIQKNPKAFKNLKSQYEELKSNNMLD